MNQENIQMNINEINTNPLHCSSCYYTSKDKSNFKRHIASVKHKNKMNDVIKIHQCETCMKVFNSRQVLHTHNKSCSVKHQENKQTQQAIHQSIPNEVLELLTKQTELIAKLTEKLEQQSQQPQKIVYDNSNNQVINIKFNMNTYLNDTCCDAYNFEDTLPSIIDEDVLLAFDDKKLTNRELYSKMINGFWKKIPQTKRPIQATDLRRNNYYIKTKGEWVKSNIEENKPKILDAIHQLKRLGIRTYQELYKANKIGDSDKCEIKAIKLLLAVGSIANWNDVFEEALPQILSKNTIDKKLIGDYDDG
jgi:DNA repair protein RadC